MSTHSARPLSLLGLLLAVACGTDTLPTTPSAAAKTAEGAPTLTVYSQNVYVGTDVDAVLGAPADQLPSAIGQALMTFAATDWPSRADAMAARIVSANADVVALNELTILTVNGLEPLLPNLAVDFLPILQAQIAARGGKYRLAALVPETDANLAFGGGTIRLQDFDALLVREGLSFTTVAERQYAAKAPVSLGGLGSFDLVRGFAAVEIPVKGSTVRVVATHLEPLETAPVLQSAQAAELLAWLGTSPMRTIVAGDLNSEPRNLDPAAPYQQFVAAGFRDSWLARTGGNGDPGYTCCHATDLQNARSLLDRRLDHVFTWSPQPGQGAVKATLFGADPADRTAGGLWPSDHAGIVATVTFPGAAAAARP